MRHSAFASFLLLLIPLSVPVAAEDYRLPPPEVVDIVTAEPAPDVSFNADHDLMLFAYRDALPSIADLSRRMLRLAGMRIDPAANARYRTSFDKRFEVRRVDDGSVVLDVKMGDGERLAGTSWSHDGRSLAWVVVDDTGSRLVTTRIGVDAKPRAHPRRINTVLSGLTWMPDGQHVLVRLVPAQRGAEPPAPDAPTGPNVQESSGNTSPTRTYQDLLTNAYDEALFEYYATAQLAIVGLDGSVREIGAPGIRYASPSPDGEYLLVETVHRPFSYLQTFWSFPRTIEVWDRSGEPVHMLAEVPLAENIPIDGVRTGRRDVEWMDRAAATLIWAEALDGGDPKREVDHRDRVFSLAAPFDAEPRSVVDIEHRASGFGYFRDSRWLLTREYDRDRRWLRSIVHDLTGEAEPRVIEDRSIRDRYGDPGSVVTAPDENGRNIPLQHGDWIYRAGRGASPEGDLPFLDRQNLRTLETERLWRCEPGTYESAVDIVSLDGDGVPVFLTVGETPTTPPNFKLRNLADGSSRTLTHFPDPTPSIRGVTKRLVTYEREDGVPLSATLYLPADYEQGRKLPLLVWAYPREFNDVKTAGQVSGSDARFTRIAGSSHLTLLTQGYAIMDDATMPVIGDAETMNDTFVEQIVAAAEAAIEKAVEMGVADGKHVGVAGHSYGAFMTANLLAHSDLFQAGIARSGAYNRTLTPFGFQAERRPLWEAKSVYYEISPFLHADKIDEPILLIHGEADNNSGTFPIQSQRLYQAIKGNGGTVRLVMLPNESHGYRAKESILHVQAEMIDWFDRFLKEADGAADAP